MEYIYLKPSDLFLWEDKRKVQSCGIGRVLFQSHSRAPPSNIGETCGKTKKTSSKVYNGHSPDLGVPRQREYDDWLVLDHGKRATN